MRESYTSHAVMLDLGMHMCR